MCQYNKDYILVKVLIPADLSHTGRERWDKKPIDKCIANIVVALQKAGINMRSSCCGHGRGDGEILLQDGRVLTIHTPKRKGKCGLHGPFDGCASCTAPAVGAEKIKHKKGTGKLEIKNGGKK